MEIEQVTKLVGEFTEMADFVEAFDELEEGYWGVRCGRVDVAIAFNSEAETLTLQAILGRPAEVDRLPVYMALLGITGQARRGRGIRMALDGPGGDVIQECSIALENLDERKLEDITSFFCAKATRGMKLMQSSSSDDDTEPHASSGPEPGAIRV